MPQTSCLWHWADSQNFTQNGSLTFLTNIHRWVSPGNWLRDGDLNSGGLLGVVLESTPVEGEGKENHWGWRDQAVMQSQWKTANPARSSADGTTLTFCWHNRARWNSHWMLTTSERVWPWASSSLQMRQIVPREGWQLRVVCWTLPPGAGYEAIYFEMRAWFSIRVKTLIHEEYVSRPPVDAWNHK